MRLTQKGTLESASYYIDTPMIIIADSGATKTDWYICSRKSDKRLKVRTKGINSAIMSYDDIAGIVAETAAEAGGEVADAVEEIYFYGAGIVCEKAAIPLKNAISEVFHNIKKCSYASDLVGAATALFGNGRGVAAIMGTGSNSCLYNNGKIIKNIRPGGFILGDEGSGAALGKAFLSDYFKELVPEKFKAKADDIFNIEYATAVAEIYKGLTPSRYLASFAKFIIENKDNTYASRLIENNIRAFIERSLSRYGCSEIGIVGSLGYACKEELEKIGAEYGLRFVKFLNTPIDALVDYHLQK